MFMILNIYKGREMFDKMVRDGNFHEAIHLKLMIILNYLTKY